MIKRREMILGIPAGFGALLGTNLLSGITQAAEKPAIKTVGGPLSVILRESRESINISGKKCKWPAPAD